MRFHNSVLALLVLSLLLFVVVTPTRASTMPVRGASNYGSNSDITFTDCVTGAVADACEAFNLTPTVVSFDAHTYDVDQFVFGGSGESGTIFDIVDLGDIAPGTTFALPAIFDPALTEVFSCNNQLTPTEGGSTSAFDSGDNSVTGPCTPGLTAAPDISESAGLFTTGPSFSVSDLVLDAPAPTPIPEPSSFVLLGVGLLAVGFKVRRTQQAR